jgi:hypothetical protein
MMEKQDDSRACELTQIIENTQLGWYEIRTCVNQMTWRRNSVTGTKLRKASALFTVRTS